MMKFFNKKLVNKEHEPRLAFRTRRNGTTEYCVETWQCYEYGCFYSSKTEWVEDRKLAEKMLKDITDQEIISWGVVKEGGK